MPTYTTRPATQADIPAMRDFVTREDIASRYTRRFYTEDELLRLLKSEHRHVLLATSADSIVGLCQYGIPIMDDCDCEDLRAIHALLVPESQADADTLRQVLIQAVEETINADATVQRLSIYVDAHNSSRIKFFAKLGFHHEMVEDTETEWYMEKDL